MNIFYLTLQKRLSKYIKHIFKIKNNFFDKKNPGFPGPS